jgi:hypothetical protein
MNAKVYEYSFCHSRAATRGEATFGVATFGVGGNPIHTVDKSEGLDLDRFLKFQ